MLFPHHCAIIFAGGKSSRMGQDKALLPFAGSDSLAHYQYHRLKRLFGRVYLGSKSEKFGFDAPVILDRYPQHSPLAGLLSLFEALDEEECFILSVDAPFVESSIIATLLEADKVRRYDAVIAQSPHGIEPLCGLYRRSIVPLAETYLASDRHRMTALLRDAHTLFVSFDDKALFDNLNRPEEYAAALGRIEAQ
jgi:molybdopterin-guanine dinucleotide biosynthesis protein A